MTNYIVPAFNTYACHGDSVTFEYEGFDIVVTLLPDWGTAPTDFDCYTEEQVEAWERDEWYYCTLKVAACREGLELGTDYIGAVEMSFPGSDNGHLSQCVAEHGMVEHAVIDARAALQRLAI